MNISRVDRSSNSSVPNTVLSKEKITKITNSADKTIVSIKHGKGGPPLNLDDIKTSLTRGNVTLQRQLDTFSRLTKNLQFQANQLWVKTILTEFNIDPKVLICRGAEWKDPIKQLIPKMAALISAKLEEQKASNSSVSISHLEPDASQPLVVEGGGGGSARTLLLQQSQDVNAPQMQVASDGTIMEGEFKDGKLDGVGKITYLNGRVESGKFKAGKLDGFGKINFASGEISIGEFKAGQWDGVVKITYLSGESIEGKFKDGKLVGDVNITRIGTVEPPSSNLNKELNRKHEEGFPTRNKLEPDASQTHVVGDGGGGATSQKVRNFHFRESKSWIKNNNSQVASDVRIESVEPPSELKGKPEEGFPPIKQLIPDRAALISAKLNEQEASNPSIPIIHLEPDASQPLVVEGGGGGANPQNKVASDGRIMEGDFKDREFEGAGKTPYLNERIESGEPPSIRWVRGGGGSARSLLLQKSQDVAHHQELVDNGVHTQLVERLDSGDAANNVKEHAANVLCNLSRSTAIQPQLIAAGVHIKLGALLSDPLATPEAKEFAAGALLNLSKNKDIQVQLREDGVYRRLVQIIVNQSPSGLTEIAREAFGNGARFASSNPYPASAPPMHPEDRFAGASAPPMHPEDRFAGASAPPMPEDPYAGASAPPMPREDIASNTRVSRLTDVLTQLSRITRRVAGWMTRLGG